MFDTTWPKKIHVDRKIVNVLSKSLYSDFPRAIREIVSNAYDADATIVKIDLDLKNHELIIEDNGNGISTDNFDKYLRIAGSSIDANEYSPKFHRKRIGRFGIGFLAGFPFCEKIEIRSKRQGEDIGFTALLPARRYSQGSAVEEDISDILVNGYNEPNMGKPEDHFTQIRLIGLNDLVGKYFDIESDRQISIQSWDGFRRLEWHLGETLPLDVENLNSPLALIYDKPAGIKVYLNGKNLYRTDPGGELVASSGNTFIKLGGLEFRYIITTNWRIIHPIEARGLKIRLNNVGIGPRTYFEVEKVVRTFSRLYWLTGDIEILAGLNEELNISRDSFTWSPQYEALQEFFRHALTNQALWVEKVAVAEKKITEVLRRSDEIPLISKDEVITANINVLKKAGFEVVNTPQTQSQLKSLVAINKKKRQVYVNDNVESEKQHQKYNETLLKSGYKLTYGMFNSNIPIRFVEPDTIQVNKSYTPFSRPKGISELLKRIHIIVYEAKLCSKSTNEMYDYIVQHLKQDI